MPFAPVSDGKQVYYEVRGHENGPNVFLGPHFYATPNPMIAQLGIDDPTDGWVEELGKRYRLILADYPPGQGKTEWTIPDEFTPERAVADFAAVADAAGAERFAWIGYSYGGVIGLQVARRTNRLTALVCGGWPALGGPYQKMLQVCIDMVENPPPGAENAPRGAGEQAITFYRHLRDWPEREEVAQIQCPCMVFMGDNDNADGVPYPAPLAEMLGARQADLEALGWTVRWIPDGNHLTSVMPAVAVPPVLEFLDTTLPG